MRRRINRGAGLAALACTGLLSLGGPAVANGLMVDDGLTGQTVQTGYAAWTGLAQPYFPASQVFSNVNLGFTTQTVNATFNATGSNPGGDNKAGFYNNSGVTGPFANLLNDYYFGRKNLSLTLAGLQAGDYVLKTVQEHPSNGDVGNCTATLTSGLTNLNQNNVYQSGGAGSQVGTGGTFQFSSNGSTNVVLSETRNSTGSYDNININAFEVHKLGPFRVDLGAADVGGGVDSPAQSGFSPWHFNAATAASGYTVDSVSHSTTFTANLGNGTRTFSATLQAQGNGNVGGTAFNTQTGTGGSMDNLATGGYFAQNTDLLLTFTGLAAGQYDFVTFSRGAANPNFLDYTVTDAAGTQTGTIGQTASASTPGDMWVGDFSILSNGLDPITFRLHPEGGSTNAYLNGFTLQEDPGIPEPLTIGLLGAGLLALARRRRAGAPGASARAKR